MTATTPTTKETNKPLGARELFCGECGYGIVVRRDPPQCPMCQTTSWSTRPGFARWN